MEGFCEETGVQVPVWAEVSEVLLQRMTAEVGMKILHGKYGVEEAATYEFF